MKLNELLNKARSLKVLVIGDLMIDRYLTGQIHRRSPEADVPILLHQASEEKAGGAANVALNFSAFGCKTHLLGVVGVDSDGAKLEKLMVESGVQPHFLKDENRPTTVKTRVLNGTEHLLRVDFESKSPLSSDMEDRILRYVNQILDEHEYDICVFQDYNKGLLTERLIKELIDELRRRAVFISVDPKYDHYWAFEGVDLFKPNLKEALAALGQTTKDDNLNALMQTTQDRLQCKTLAITLSEDGISIKKDGKNPVSTPTSAISIVDVCGAGDAVLCSLSLSAFYGWSEDEMGVLGNQTGAQVCMKSGVVVVEPHLLA